MKYLLTACTMLVTAGMLLAGPNALSAAKSARPSPVQIPDTMNAAWHHGGNNQPGHNQPSPDRPGWNNNRGRQNRGPDRRNGWEYHGQVRLDPFVFWAREWAAWLNFEFHPKPRLGAISGQVLNAEGYPIEDAEVIVRSENDEYRAHTREHGFYLVDGVKPGYYSVSVLRWGYEPRTGPDLISIWPRRVARDVDFTLYYNRHQEE